MKTLITLSLLCFYTNVLFSNPDTLRSHHALKIHASGEYSRSILGDSYGGFDIGGGYALHLEAANQIRGSIGVELSTFKFDSENNRLSDVFNLSLIGDTIRTLESGNLSHQQLSLIVPIRFYIPLSKKNKLHLLAGVRPTFILKNKSTWNYSSIEYNTVTFIDISTTTGLSRSLKQAVYAEGGSFHVGLSYLTNHWMMEFAIGFTQLRFEDNFKRSESFTHAGLGLYYFFN